MNDAQNNLPAEPSADATPWLVDGASIPEHEGFLIGNRPGLELLKRKLDEALASGECGIEEDGVDFTGIRVVDRDPREEPEHESFKQTIAKYGCLLVLVVALFVLSVGVISICNWIKN